MMYREWMEKLCDSILTGKIPLKGDWHYTDGVILKSMEYVYAINRDERCPVFIQAYLDQYIKEDGDIAQITKELPNVDQLNNGKVIFEAYRRTGNEKYFKALKMIREKIDTLPRLDGYGGFAHKQIYYNQMWLDGLYMLQPLYAQFAKEWEQPECFDDIAKQFRLITEFCYDEEKALFYHGYDHTKSIFWADPVTGRSANFWGRAMGWLSMACVDTLDYFPKEYVGRQVILDVIGKLAKGICRYQSESGVWYQVLDQGDREGNYLEASCSCMYAYFLKKAMLKGYLDSSYEPVLEKAMEGIFREFITVDEAGNMHVHHICAVAGLGPASDTRRDGTFEYYISEPIKEDSGMAVGPLLGVLALYALNE